MPYVTDLQVRNHLRIEADDDVSVYVAAAEAFAQQFLNRNVYDDADSMAAAILDGSAGDDPVVADDLIRAAVLLITGHLYANREDVVTGVSAAELPMNSLYLLQPYRRQLGV